MTPKRPSLSKIDREEQNVSPVLTGACWPVDLHNGPSDRSLKLRALPPRNLPTLGNGQTAFSPGPAPVFCLCGCMGRVERTGWGSRKEGVHLPFVFHLAEKRSLENLPGGTGISPTRQVQADSGIRERSLKATHFHDRSTVPGENLSAKNSRVRGHVFVLYSVITNYI